MESRYMADASGMQKECGRLEARDQEIDSMFMSLYTDKAKGILSEPRFLKLTAALEQEENRRYATVQELDEAVLNRLISRILVGRSRKWMDGRPSRSRSCITSWVRYRK